MTQIAPSAPPGFPTAEPPGAQSAPAAPPQQTDIQALLANAQRDPQAFQAAVGQQLQLDPKGQQALQQFMANPADPRAQAALTQALGAKNPQQLRQIQQAMSDAAQKGKEGGGPFDIIKNFFEGIFKAFGLGQNNAPHDGDGHQTTPPQAPDAASGPGQAPERGAQPPPPAAAPPQGAAAPHAPRSASLRGGRHVRGASSIGAQFEHALRAAVGPNATPAARSYAVSLAHRVLSSNASPKVKAEAQSFLHPAAAGA